MRPIDADALQRRICGAICGCEYEDCGNEGYCGYDHFISNAPTINAVHAVRCRECKNYVIVDEFEGGKRYMCLVNHFSYLDNDGDNQFCNYGERKEGADNG